jgi:hypothetical protein
MTPQEAEAISRQLQEEQDRQDREYLRRLGEMTPEERAAHAGSIDKLQKRITAESGPIKNSPRTQG